VVRASGIGLQGEAFVNASETIRVIPKSGYRFSARITRKHNRMAAEKWTPVFG